MNSFCLQLCMYTITNIKAIKQLKGQNYRDDNINNKHTEI